MTIYQLTKDALAPVGEVTLASQGIKERHDLQRILRTHIDAISPDTFVLVDEYSQWEDSRRSIDLLCLDKDANLVVVELKRTEDGGHMELQAIRYAAMVSKMTLADAVDAHAAYLRRNGGNSSEAESAILKFLDWEEANEDEFAQNVRIVLVSADFGKEITTAVMWLNEHELDIRCVRLRPYKLGESVLLDIQQVLPLPEAGDYVVQIRKKAAKQRESQAGGVDWSRYDLKVGDQLYPAQRKRQLFLRTVLALVENGVNIREIQNVMPASKLLGFSGNLTSEEFRKKALETAKPNGGSYDLRRFYTEDEELFRSEGSTWAVSNQWSIHRLPLLDELIAKYPQAHIAYTKVAGANEG